jgi:hypothetical protein
VPLCLRGSKQKRKMNIREEILLEHSKKQALKIADYACTSPAHFKELMNCFLENNYRVAQRAAYSVSWAALRHPKMIDPYLGTLVKQLKRTDVHEAIPRNCLRILESVNIPSTYHGEVMDACFEFAQDPKTPIAIKAASLTILYNLSKVYPEIRSELKLIIETQWENETAAFRSRGKKILKALNGGK